MQGPVARMLEQAPAMPASLRSVCDYLLAERSGIETMSMAQVAQATYTSKPTLVRFAQRLGYAGWGDFRLAVLDDFRTREEEEAREAGVDVNYPFAPGDGADRIARRLARVKAFAVSRILADIESEPFDEAARLLRRAKTITLFGASPNRSYCELFAYNLGQLGVACSVPHGEDIQVASRLMGPGDCAIFVSYSGVLARMPNVFAQQVRDQGTRIISVTRKDSPLAGISDAALTFGPHEHYGDKIAGYYSCASVDFLLDTLYSTCFVLDFGRNSKAKERFIRRYEQTGGEVVDLG